VRALAIFNDGRGEALYVGGNLVSTGDLDGTRGIGRWDGASWDSLSGGIEGSVFALSAFEFEGRPALFVGGHTHSPPESHSWFRVWDGQQWILLQDLPNDFPRAFAIFDDGSGPALYAAGYFDEIGDTVVNGVAKWDGGKWTPLAEGLRDLHGRAFVHALEVYDDGTGPALYAGGTFVRSGSTEMKYLARWDGERWSAVAPGLRNTVYALETFDDGAGSSLAVGGGFSLTNIANGSRIARWNGSNWSALGEGFNDDVFSLYSFDDGSGPALYAGGRFLMSGAVPMSRVARWDGEAWSPLADGLSASTSTSVNVMLAHQAAGQDPTLYAGGYFFTSGPTLLNRVAKWTGDGWRGMGEGIERAPTAITEFDDGEGTAVYTADGVNSGVSVIDEAVAKWDGDRWLTLGAPPNSTVHDLQAFDDGSGGSLYAAGVFTQIGGIDAHRIAKWDGVEWSPVGLGARSAIYCLEVFDDGVEKALYAGGRFVEIGGVDALRIAKWNGATWSPLGLGVNADVDALTVYDLGAGPQLFVGGGFQNAGGQTARGVASWNGEAWSALGAGVSGDVHALKGFDDGTGPALYVAGRLFLAGGASVERIARWDGEVWAPVGAGFNDRVFALEVFDDGMGPALFAAGAFTASGDTPIRHLAKWVNGAWVEFDGGADQVVSVLSALGLGKDTLWVGGQFSSVAGVSAGHIAAYRRCANAGSCPGDLNLDGFVDFADLNQALTENASGGLDILNTVLSNFGVACDRHIAESTVTE
jgi:hypothetical protein